MATFTSYDHAGHVTGRIVLGVEAFAQSRVGIHGTAWGASRTLVTVADQSEALAHMLQFAVSVRATA